MSGKSVDDVEQGADSLDKGGPLGSPDGPNDWLDRIANVFVRAVDDTGSYKKGQQISA